MLDIHDSLTRVKLIVYTRDTRSVGVESSSNGYFHVFIRRNAREGLVWLVPTNILQDILENPRISRIFTNGQSRLARSIFPDYILFQVINVSLHAESLE